MATGRLLSWGGINELKLKTQFYILLKVKELVILIP